MSELVPETWAIQSISNIAKVGSSKRILQSEYVADGVPFFRSKEVILRSKRKQIKDTLYIARSRFDELKAKFGAPKTNDILVTAVGTIGTIYLIEDIEFYFKDGNLLWIKDINDSVHPQYLAKYMASDVFQTAIERISGGSSQSALTIEKLSQLELNLPTLPEQQKIAQILTSIDEVIEKTQAQIDKLKDLKTAMMQELLTKGIGHVEFKDSPVGTIPVGWDVVELENLVNTDKNITYGIVQAGPYCDGGIPYIRVSDMNSRHLNREGMLLTSPAIAEKFKRSAVSTGDIVYALRGMIGHVHMVPSQLDGANLTQGTARISPCQTINSNYLLWAMKSPYVAVQNDLEAKGSTFREVTLASLRKIKVCVPTIDEQQKIVSVLEGIDEKTFAVQDKLTLIKSIKKALMQDLLTGKVRVNTELSNSSLAAG
jgi:type I restriction enzyme S subunit